MKGMDEFVWVFVAAVIALIVVALIGLYMGGVPEPGPGTPASNYTLLGNFSLGRVGYSGSSPIRTEDMGSFVAGEPQVEGLKSLSELRVAASLIGLENREYTLPVLEEILPEVRDAKVSFNVDDTNSYGDLVIKWNGKEVFRRKAPVGHYSFTIGKEQVKTANNLEIYCEGPGLLFWATTVYNMKDFRVNLVSGLTKHYQFYIGAVELDSFDKGVINLGFGARGSGSLLVRLNEMTLFDERPSPSETIEFSYDNVAKSPKIGNNMITFSVDEGSFSVEDADLEIYLSSEQVRKRGFDVYSSMLEEFGKGVLEVRVGEIVKSGELEISINGRGLEVPDIQEGLNELTFTKDLLQEGRNDIEFSGTGAFDITRVEIGFEK